MLEANSDGKTNRENTKNTAKKFSYEDLQKSDYVPAKAYIEVSQTFMDKNSSLKSPQKAYEVLNLGAKRIGSNYRFLPHLIAAAKSSGNIKLAEQYTIECSKNQDTGLMQDVVDIPAKIR